MGRRAPLLAALCVALSACGGGDGPQWESVTLTAPATDFSDPGAAPLPATLEASGRRSEVVLTPVAAGGSAAAFDVRAASDGAAIGRLLLGDGPAALQYHLASRDSGLPVELLEPNRLAVVEGRDRARLGLLIAEDASLATPRTLSIADLPVAAVARLVALAQVLGAWDVVARNRYPVGADGAPRLPFFAPEAPGDWRVLTQRSPAAFLPASLGRWFVASPRFRELHYRALAEYARRLPGLASAAEDFAAAGPPVLADPITALAAQDREAARALAGYLDSVWIELIVRAQPPDAARVVIDVYSVSEISLDALVLSLPRQLLLVGNREFAALRLRPVGPGEAIAGTLGRNRLEFPLAAAVAPRPIGPTRFAGVRLEYRLAGLAALDRSFWPALEGLQLRATNHTTGEPVEEAHVTRLVSFDDPRFAVGDAPEVDAWLAELDGILTRADGGPAQLVRAADGRSLRLPAGDYRLRGDLVLPEGQGLVLEAGVDLRVGAGHSLLVRGPLDVRGTADRPVRVGAVDGAGPWGVLAAQGRGRSALGKRERPRSRIRQLELSGGSQDLLRGVRYTGQLSVYHQDLLLEHSELRGARADDALNVKYGDAVIRDCRFVENAADGVDLDGSAATIERSYFHGGGSDGDGLDVSGARVAVTDSVFSDFRDKCVSVGEASTLDLRGSLLRRCAIGLASKDSSLAVLEQSLLLDNDVDLAAYQKKAMFGGGRIRAADVLSINAGVPEDRDGLSELTTAEVRSVAQGWEVGVDAALLREAGGFSSGRYRALGAPGR